MDQVGGGGAGGPSSTDHGLLDEMFVQVGSVTLGAEKAAVAQSHRQSISPSRIREAGRCRVRGAAL